MRSPAWAIAWELWRPHRAMLGWMLAALVVVGVVFHAMPPATMTPDQAVAWCLLTMGDTMLIYAILAFTYTTEGTDLASARSNFPARMFTLPVRTHVLVGWPMLLGAGFLALTWVVGATLARARWGVLVPLGWPAVGVAAFLAWFQVVAWWPFALPWLRVVVSFSLMAALVILPILAVHYAVAEWLLIAAFAAFLPPAYFTALAGVSRARRGHDRSWRSPRRDALALQPPAEPRRLFTSAARAQLWYEWRRNWLGLPLMTSLVLVLFAALFWFEKAYEPVIHEIERVERLPPQIRMAFLSLFVLLLVLAAITGVELGKTGSKGLATKGFTLPAFQAVQPMSSAAMVAAKLQAAAWITLVCWVLVGIAAPLILLGTGTTEEAVGWIRDWLAAQSPLKATTFLLVAAVVGIGVTWASMARTMFLGLMGRAWIAHAVLLVVLFASFPVLGTIKWISKHPESHANVAAVLPWVLSGAVGLKVLVGVWVVRRVRRAGLITDRALIRLLAAWAVVTAGLFGCLRWLVPETAAAWYVLALGMILVVPIGSLLAAPLALAWNRHR
jgi:hypothetical protein